MAPINPGGTGTHKLAQRLYKRGNQEVFFQELISIVPGSIMEILAYTAGANGGEAYD